MKLSVEGNKGELFFNDSLSLIPNEPLPLSSEAFLANTNPWKIFNLSHHNHPKPLYVTNNHLGSLPSWFNLSEIHLKERVAFYLKYHYFFRFILKL